MVIYLATHWKSCLGCLYESALSSRFLRRHVAAWLDLPHPTLQSYVIQCHHFLVVNLFVPQHGVIWLFPSRVLPQSTWKPCSNFQIATQKLSSANQLIDKPCVVLEKFIHSCSGTTRVQLPGRPERGGRKAVKYDH